MLTRSLGAGWAENCIIKMPFKINIAEKSGKTFKLELESESLLGKELHNKIEGKDISPDLEGYEFEITGTSDKAGFTSHKDVPGIGLKKLLLSYEKGMHQRPRREGKFKVANKTRKGLRLRKTVRGRVISPDIIQINLKILKEGNKKLQEIFPDQNMPKPVEGAEAPKTEEAAPATETLKTKETPKTEEKKEESAEEKKE